MSDTPRTMMQVMEADGYRTKTEAIAHMVDFCGQLERELGVANDAANRSDTIAAERLREIGRVADLVLSLADSPLSLMGHLKPWAERHCTLNAGRQP